MSSNEAREKFVSTADIKRVYCKAPVNLAGEEWKPVADSQFDRWLQAHDANLVVEFMEQPEFKAMLDAVAAAKISEQQVWQMARFQHDFALDSDNVPAFVEPLLGALREAGVPFDEKPFIEGGYLLPAAPSTQAHP